MIELERNLLGLVMGLQIDPVQLGLEEKHFSSFYNQEIWNACLYFVSKKLNPDVIVVSDYLADKHPHDAAMGSTWYADLVEICRDSLGKVTAKNHVKIIKEGTAKNLFREFLAARRIDVN